MQKDPEAGRAQVRQRPEVVSREEQKK